jgi:hypothetical protein
VEDGQVRDELMREIFEKLRDVAQKEKAMKARVFSSWKDVGISHEELERDLNAFLEANIKRENAKPSRPVLKLVTQSESQAETGRVSLTVIVWYE